MRSSPLSNDNISMGEYTSPSSPSVTMHLNPQSSPSMGNNSVLTDHLSQLMNAVNIQQNNHTSPLDNDIFAANGDGLLTDPLSGVLGGSSAPQANLQSGSGTQMFSSFFSSASLNVYPPTAVTKATLNGKINQQRAGFPVCYNVQTAKVTLKLFLNQNPANPVLQMTQNRLYQYGEVEKVIAKLNPNEVAIIGFVVFCENSSKKREVLTPIDTYYSQSVNNQEHSINVAIGTYGRKCSADLVKHCSFLVAYRMDNEAFNKQSNSGSGSFLGLDEAPSFDKGYVQEIRFGFRKKSGREKLPLIKEPIPCDVSKPVEFYDFAKDQPLMKLDDLLYTHYQPITRFCTSVQEAADAVVTQPADGISVKDLKNIRQSTVSTPTTSHTMDDASDNTHLATPINNSGPTPPVQQNQTPMSTLEEDGFDMYNFNMSILDNLSKSSVERWSNCEPVVNEHPSYLAVLLGLIYSRGSFSIETKGNNSIPITIDVLDNLITKYYGTVTVGTISENIQINLKDVFIRNDINLLLFYLQVKELVPCFVAGVYLYCLLYFTKSIKDQDIMKEYVTEMRTIYTQVTQQFYLEDFKLTLDIGDSLVRDNSSEFVSLAFKKLKAYAIKIGKYYNTLIVQHAVQHSVQNYEFNKQQRLDNVIVGLSNYFLGNDNNNNNKRERDIEYSGAGSSFTGSDLVTRPRRTFALQKYEEQKMRVFEIEKNLLCMQSYTAGVTENAEVLQTLYDLECRRAQLEKEFEEKLRILAEKERNSM